MIAPESLEERRLLAGPSAEIVAGNLQIVGTPEGDVVTVEASDPTQIQVKINDQSYGPFDLSAGGRIIADLDAGDDALAIVGGASDDQFVGGAGFDRLSVTADVDFTLDEGTVSGPGTDVFSGIEAVDLIGGPGDNTFVVDAWIGATTLDGAGGTDSARVNGTAGPGPLTFIGAVLTSGGSTVGLARVEDIAIDLQDSDYPLTVNETTLAGALTVTGGFGPITVGGVTVSSLDVTGGTVTLGSITAGSDGIIVGATTIDIGGSVSTSNGHLLLGATDLITIAAVSIATGTGTQVYDGSIILTGDAVLTGGGIDLEGTIDGAFSLTANSGGTTAFRGMVGGTDPLVSVETDAPGSTAVAASITTFGALTFYDPVALAADLTTAGALILTAPVVLAADVTLTGTNYISIDGTLDGAFALAFHSGGFAAFRGTVGGTTPLASVVTDAPGTTILRASMTTSGDLTFNDPVILEADVTLTGRDIVFASTLGVYTYYDTFSLTANGAGTTWFLGTVGGTDPLVSVVTDAPGITVIAASMTAFDALTFNDPVILAADVTLSSQAIVFAGTLDSGEGAVSLTADGASTTFGGAVGGTNPLASVVTDEQGTTFIAASMTTTGDQLYLDNVVLGPLASFNAGGSLIFGRDVTLPPGSTGVTFVVTDGGTVDLSSLTVPLVVEVRVATPTTEPIVVIGGQVQNTFIKAEDQPVTVTFIGGGPGSENLFQVVPTGDVTLVDQGGDNTIDLSGSSLGLTVDLSLNQGLPQSVFAGAPRDPDIEFRFGPDEPAPAVPGLLRLVGTFQKLIDSPNDDTLFAAPSTSAPTADLATPLPGSLIILTGGRDKVFGAPGAAVQSFSGGDRVAQAFDPGAASRVGAFLAQNAAVVQNYLASDPAAQSAFLQRNPTGFSQYLVASPANQQAFLQRNAAAVAQFLVASPAGQQAYLQQNATAVAQFLVASPAGQQAYLQRNATAVAQFLAGTAAGQQAYLQRNAAAVAQFLAGSPAAQAAFLQQGAAGVGAYLVSNSAARDAFLASDPAAQQAYLQTGDAGLQAYLLANPGAVAQYLAAYPAALQQYLASSPTALQQYLISNPTAQAAYIRENAAAIAQFLAGSPAGQQAYLQRNAAAVAQFLAINPAAQAAFLQQGAAGVNAYLVSNAPARDAFLARDPAAQQAYLLGGDAGLQAYLQASPAAVAQYLAANPAALQQYLTSSPTALQQYLSGNPAGLLAYLQQGGAAMAQFITSSPAGREAYLLALQQDASAVAQFLAGDAAGREAYLQRNAAGIGAYLISGVAALNAFLASDPAAQQAYLRGGDAGVQAYLQANPGAVAQYLAADPAVLQQFLTSSPAALQQYLAGNPTAQAAYIQQNAAGIAQFLAGSPAGQQAYLQRDAAGVSAFLISNVAARDAFLASDPAALQAYDQDGDAGLQAYLLRANPAALTQYLAAYPAVLQQYLTSRSGILTEYLAGNSAVLQQYLVANPTVLQQYLAGDPSTLQQFLAGSPAALQQYLTAHPTVLQQFLNASPTVLQQYLRSNPTALQQYLTSGPAILHQYIVSNPAALQQYLMGSPTVLQQYLTGHPTALEQYLTSDPAILQQFITGNPAALQQYLTSSPTILQQYLINNPTAQAAYIRENAAALAQFLAISPAAQAAFLQQGAAGVAAYLVANVASRDAFLESDPAALQAYDQEGDPGLQAYLQANPAALTQYLAAYPAVLQQYLTSDPAILQQYITSYPAVLQQYLAASPTVLQQYLTGHPTALEQYLTSDPAILQQFITGNPAALQQFLTGNPAVLQQFLADRPDLLRQVLDAAVLDLFRFKVTLAGGGHQASGGVLSTFHLGSGLFVEEVTPEQVELVNQAVGRGAAIENYLLRVSFDGGENVVAGGLLGTFASGGGADRFVIQDPSLLGLPPDTPLLAAISRLGGTFDGGGGDDTFYFVGGGEGDGLGHVTLGEPAGSGVITLDFSSFQGGGITLDLTRSDEQQLGTGSWLTLPGGAGVASVVGSPGADTILGTERDDVLQGAEPRADHPDERPAVPPAEVSTQWVLLDFDHSTSALGSRVYTADDRAAVLEGLQRIYAPFANIVRFTLDAAVAQANAPGGYATVFFNDTPVVDGSPRPGGRSSEIDFRNLNRTTTVQVDVNGFLGDGPGQVAATEAHFRNLSITIAAHEVAHTLGLRHGDAPAPIGFGIPNPPGRADFLPAFPGLVGAFDTRYDVIASPASVGSSLADAASNQVHFGAREAVKLAFIAGGTVVDGTLAPHNSLSTAQPVGLYTLDVPNPITSGFAAGKAFDVAAVDVTGHIGPGTEVVTDRDGHPVLDSNGNPLRRSVSDFYSFRGRAGDLMSFEVLSATLTRIDHHIDAVLRVYGPDGQLVAYASGVAENDDSFEPPDAAILDLRLPQDGTYIVEVDTFHSNDPMFLDPDSPHYNPEAYYDTIQGDYELFLYRFATYNALDGADQLDGRGGDDTLAGGPGDDRLIGGPGDDTLTGGTGLNDLDGGGGTDTVREAGDVDFSLSGSLLTGPGTDVLGGIQRAVLTGGAGANRFTIASSWTGDATLDGAGGRDTLSAPGTLAGTTTVVSDLDLALVAQDLAGTLALQQNLGSALIGGTLSGQLTVGGRLDTLTVGQDVAGTIAVAGTIGTAQVQGSVSRTAVIGAGSLDSMTIGPDLLSPGHDLAGQLVVSPGGKLGDLRVAGGTPGTIVAGRIGTVRVDGGYGPLVLQITEGGITRRVEAAVPTDPYPVPAPLPAAAPAGVTFRYVYESGTLASPQLTIRVTNGASTARDQFDLSLVTYNPTAQFNLARLDGTGVTGIRNVAVEGDLLGAVTAAAGAFFPGAANPAGVFLPSDDLAAVAVRDFIPSGGRIRARSIQAVAAGSLARSDGQVVTGAAASATDVARLLATGTVIASAADVFRVPFANRPGQRVGLFVATAAAGGSFDANAITFTVQDVVTADPSGGGRNVVQVSNAARGAVTALVTAVPTFDAKNRRSNSVVQTIALRGEGGSLRTSLPVTGLITSTGPLGDVTLLSSQVLASLAAPSIFGTLDLRGGVSGDVQTTGVGVDPISGATIHITPDFGRVYYATPGNPASLTATPLDATRIGRVISRGRLLAQISAGSGVIAAQGDIGAFVGTARVGGIAVNGPFSSQIVALGRLIGDLRLNGGLRGGRIAIQGDILGNATVVSGGLDAASALVSGGSIGSADLETRLAVNGPIRGILAARGAINVSGSLPSSGTIFTGTNAAAVDAIFQDFDLTPDLDLGGLALVLGRLKALRVLNGQLTI